MSIYVKLLRLALILVSVFATMYSGSIGDYAYYTFAILFYTAAMTLRERTALPSLQGLLFLGELILSAYLLHTYHGEMAYLFTASLLLNVELYRSLPLLVLLSALQFAVMNSMIEPMSIETALAPNIALAIASCLLLYAKSLSLQKHKYENIFDDLRRQQFELIEARQTVVEYARKVENATQLEERNRISRDIHDEIGHKLIRLKMMMEAALQILPDKRDKGMELLFGVRDQLTDSMETLRSTVRNLKPQDAEMRQYSLSALIDNFARDSGIQVLFESSGPPYPLYPSEEVLLYRNAQEAMTNALRHGGATVVWIKLHYDTEQIRFSVSNNGRLPESIGKKGLGISGMEERIQMLGGSLQFQLDERFTVTTVLPHRTYRPSSE